MAKNLKPSFQTENVRLKRQNTGVSSVSNILFLGDYWKYFESTSVTQRRFIYSESYARQGLFIYYYDAKYDYFITLSSANPSDIPFTVWFPNFFTVAIRIISTEDSIRFVHDNRCFKRSIFINLCKHVVRWGPSSFIISQSGSVMKIHILYKLINNFITLDSLRFNFLLSMSEELSVFDARNGRVIEMAYLFDSTYDTSYTHKINISI